MNTWKNKIKKEHIYVGAILLVAFLLRVIALDSIPRGVNQDEAMAAVDAWALSKYGTDRFGMQFPVHFTAWAYGQMSVLLSYCMVPCIWLFGFTTFAIRLPMVIASVVGVLFIYLIGKKLFAPKMAYAMMAFAAINPWQFMQSRWSLDCNLFPHIFLIGFYLLLCGLEKRKYLYLSMFFFGLTFYCYGVAVYTVPVFLFVFAVWCLWKKQLKWKEILISVIIFALVALPEILTMMINMFGWETIETPWFTMAYFPESIRSNDILFLNFSFRQLGRNALSMWKQVFLQRPDALYNALPKFGPMYQLSTPFLFVGIVSFVKRLFTNKEMKSKTRDMALLGFLIMGIWAGLTTYEVNLNRINIIFYPLMILAIYGIAVCVSWFKKFAPYVRNGFVVAYAILALMFFTQYFGEFPSQIERMFNKNFLTIVQEADALEEYDRLQISANVDWQTNWKMAEILTQYACKLDALYVQGETNETGGRELLPYNQRYQYPYMQYQSEFSKDALYIVAEGDLGYLKGEFDVILRQGPFYAIDFR